MPNTKITLFAVSPVKVDGERVHQKEFDVDSQKQADALIACGAATLPQSDSEADMIDQAAAAELQKIEDDKKAAAEKQEAEKLEAKKEAAEKAESEKIAADKTAEDKANESKASNVVTLIQPPESAEERAAAIKVATINLQKENDADKFTSNNGPTIDALTTVLGWTAKAGERNQVWLAIQSESEPAE